MTQRNIKNLLSCGSSRQFLLRYKRNCILYVKEMVSKGNDTGIFSHILMAWTLIFVFQAFSITFFGEWGDMSQVSCMNYHVENTSFLYAVLMNLLFCQIATISLAADENPLGVVLGGVVYA